MAEDAIRGVLTKLGEIAVKETTIQIKVGSDIILLRDRLEWLQAVVRDADRKRRAGTVDVLTRVWVRQTRDVAFEAEDALDHFFYEQVVFPKDWWYLRYWNASIGMCRKAIVWCGLSCQIRIIKSRLDQISKNKEEYKIVHTPSVTSASSTTAIAAWQDDLENAMGFDQDVEILLKMLLPLNKIKKEQPPRHDLSPDDSMPISIVGKIVEESGAKENKLLVPIVGETSAAEVGKDLVPISIAGETGDVSGAEVKKHLVPMSTVGDTVEASGAEVNKHPVDISKDGDIVEASGAEVNKQLVPMCKDGETVEASGAEENKDLVPISRGAEMVEASGHGAEKNKQPISSKDEEIVEVSGAKKNTHPMFISIVGESGAGKNTLARIICRMMTPDKKIVVWYNMELGSSTENVLSELYRRASLKLTAEEQLQEAEISSEDIGEKLRGILTGKRYLLILGGISSKTILNSVRASLLDPGQDNDNGSRVLLILDTENEEVAWHANTMNRDGLNAVHLLTHLDQPRTAELFFWKVLRKGQYGKEVSTNRSLEEERKNEKQMKQEEEEKLVHEITGGYPMAIVLLAGLLRFKEKPVQWDAVLQQLKSGKNGTQDGGEGLTNGQVCGTRRTMEMVLWASFEDLPDDLKSCFLYFASYPANFSHPAGELVRMWIGEGFIKPQKGKTMEEVGHDYLKELVLRCLVEVEEMKVDGDIQLVRVHKSLMGFLRSEVREAGFMEIHDIHDVTVPPSARRLSVRSDNARRYTTTFASKKFPKLRSFICRIIIDDHQHDPEFLRANHHQHKHDLEFLRWSRFLRVISVQGLKLGKLPNKIGDMINLRYLRVDCPDLHSLPSSIARLPNLQTLNITNTQVEEIHPYFWKIKTLRHVLASNLMLPTTMEVVEEDRSGGGSELQTLHGVKLSYSGRWGAGNRPWKKSIRSLEMHGDQAEFKAVLGNMPLLGHLKLQGDEIPACVFTDPSLRSLQTMVLDGNVMWGNITVDVLRKARPNLVQLVLNDTSEVPQEIKEQLGTILVLQPTEIKEQLGTIPVLQPTEEERRI